MDENKKDTQGSDLEEQSSVSSRREALKAMGATMAGMAAAGVASAAATATTPTKIGRAHV